ncbi:MAG: hypothetical protein HDT46_10965 [Ruminococcaceae bacterium]|nr:hypothetical protein [Oscillospiraceae bacterium]
MMLLALKPVYGIESGNIGGVYCTFSPLWCHLKAPAAAETAPRFEDKKAPYKAQF